MTGTTPRESRPTLEALQGFLARLYTDASLRARFEAELAARDPGSAGAAAPPGLEGLNLARLRQAAVALEWKRAREARGLLPFTSVALGDAFAAAFRAHAHRVTPGGARKPLADAMAFADAMRRSPDAPVREAARFDRGILGLRFRMAAGGASPVRCEAHRRRGIYIAVARFAYAFPAVAGPPPAPVDWPRRSTVVLFVNAVGRCGVWYW